MFDCCQTKVFQGQGVRLLSHLNGIYIISAAYRRPKEHNASWDHYTEGTISSAPESTQVSRRHDLHDREAVLELGGASGSVSAKQRSRDLEGCHFVLDLCTVRGDT